MLTLVSTTPFIYSFIHYVPVASDANFYAKCAFLATRVKNYVSLWGGGSYTCTAGREPAANWPAKQEVTSPTDHAPLCDGQNF